MIYEVTGDILLSKADAIAHGVAANDPMDQGLAAFDHAARRGALKVLVRLGESE